MRARKRKLYDDDSLGLKGWAKFFNNLAMFILYPLRKPIRFVLIVAVVCGLFAAPMFLFGLNKDELPQWYGEQYSKIKDQITTYIYDIREAYGVKNMSQEQEPEEEDVYEEKETSYDEGSVEEFVSSMSAKNLRRNGRDNPYYRTSSRFNLNYLPEILELHGVADVYSPNEIAVDGVYVFLYGIYTDKNTSNYEYANNFLRDRIQGKMIRCDIVAYTENKVATAVCYDGTDNINNMLVKTHLAKKVSE